MKTQTKVIIVIIILVLIGAVIGFYFWNKKKQAAKIDLQLNETTPHTMPPFLRFPMPTETFAIPTLTLSDPNTILVESPLQVESRVLNTAQRRD